MRRGRSRPTGSLPPVRHRPTTNPVLPVVDLVAAVAFWERLGFEGAIYDEGYAWIRHSGWEWFHLRRVDSVDGNAAGAYLHVDDADAWRNAMVESVGGTVELGELVDTPWGKREFSIADPAGNLIRIGSDL